MAFISTDFAPRSFDERRRHGAVAGDDSSLDTLLQVLSDRFQSSNHD
jgi:hypothetical protein